MWTVVEYIREGESWTWDSQKYIFEGKRAAKR